MAACIISVGGIELVNQAFNNEILLRKPNQLLNSYPFGTQKIVERQVSDPKFIADIWDSFFFVELAALTSMLTTGT